MATDTEGKAALLPRFVTATAAPPGYEGTDACSMLRLARLVSLVPVIEDR